MQTVVVALGIAGPSLYLCQIGAEYVMAIIWLGLLAYGVLWTVKIISETPEYQLLQEARAIRGIAYNPRWDILRYILSRR